MKLVVGLFFMLFLNITPGNAQSYFRPNEETGVAIGVTGGFSSKNSLIGNFSLGAMIKGKSHLSINLQAFSNASEVNVPVIAEGRMGYMLGTVEIYGGAGYHYAGNEYDHQEGYFQFKNGFRPTYGAIKHFNNSLWTVGAGMSGKTFSVQIGIFAVR